MWLRKGRRASLSRVGVGCADVGAFGDRTRREIEEKGRGHGR